LLWLKEVQPLDLKKLSRFFNREWVIFLSIGRTAYR